MNLSEGSVRATRKDKLRFYTIAFASLREVQAIIDLEDALECIRQEADILGAHVYKLVNH